MPMKSKKSEYIELVKRRYVDEKWSLGEISREIGVSVQTLSRWLHEEGVELEVRKRLGDRNRSEEEQESINAKISATRIKNLREGKTSSGGRTQAPRKTIICPSCRESFTVLASSARVYCGAQCARQADADKKKRRTEEAWYASPKSLCECGERIPYVKRNTSKYCSDECRNKYGSKRQPDPTKQITFNCGTCGKQITRWKGYGSTISGKRFCDNKCAIKHTKTVRNYVIRESDMVLDSTWEMLFAGLCGYFKIECLRVDRSLATTSSEGRHYAPDFLVDGHLWVEVKGYDANGQASARQGWINQNGPLTVVDRELLDLLRLAVDGSQFVALLMSQVHTTEETP